MAAAKIITLKTSKMKNSNGFEIVKTNKNLTNSEQNNLRDLLRPLLNKEGIISMCLDNKSLFVEFNPEILTVNSIYELLEEKGFPVGFEIEQVS